MSRHRCHGDPARFEVVAEFIAERFPHARYVADVGGGQGMLTRILRKRLGVNAEVIDPTPGTLGVSACSGCCGLRVPCLSWCLFSRLRWRFPGMADARVSRRAWRAVPRSASPGGRGGS